MNDNPACGTHEEQAIAEIIALHKDRLEAWKALAGRAISHPETMTADEVQEIGWSFLMTLKRLSRVDTLLH